MAPPFLTFLAALGRVWKIWVKTGFGADVLGIVQKEEKQKRCHDQCAVIQPIAQPRGGSHWKFS